MAVFNISNVPQFLITITYIYRLTRIFPRRLCKIEIDLGTAVNGSADRRGSCLRLGPVHKSQSGRPGRTCRRCLRRGRDEGVGRGEAGHRLITYGEISWLVTVFPRMERRRGTRVAACGRAITSS